MRPARVPAHGRGSAPRRLVAAGSLWFPLHPGAWLSVPPGLSSGCPWAGSARGSLPRVGVMARDARWLRSAGARGPLELLRAVRGRPFSILSSLVNGGREAWGLQVCAPQPGPVPNALPASECPSGWERGAPGTPSEPRAGERRAARQRLRSHVVERRAEGREAGREGRGSGAEGEGEGRGRPPQFAPRWGSDTQRARSRRAGPAAAATASAASEATRAAGRAAAATAGRPRRAGLGSGCQRRRSRHRSGSGSPTALGWAGLGWGGRRAQGRARGGRRTGGLGSPGERPGTAPGPAPPRSALPSASPRARADEPRARGTWKR